MAYSGKFFFAKYFRLEILNFLNCDYLWFRNHLALAMSFSRFETKVFINERAALHSLSSFKPIFSSLTRRGKERVGWGGRRAAREGKERADEKSSQKF